MPRLTITRQVLMAMAMAVPLAKAVAADADHQACEAAILAAEQRHGIPPGLLAAIGRVESGRADAAGHARPWPWSVNAQGFGRVFASQDAALRWVVSLRARGVTSIDIGCLQVNLRHHPAAFATVADAFDPATNADYAARFLSSLRPGGTAQLDEGWLRAAGLYHSSTETLAMPYRRLVEQAYGMPASDARVMPQAVAAAFAGRLAWRRERVAAARDGARRRLEAALRVAGYERPEAGADRLAALIRLGDDPTALARPGIGRRPTGQPSGRR